MCVEKGTEEGENEGVCLAIMARLLEVMSGHERIMEMLKRRREIMNVKMLRERKAWTVMRKEEEGLIK